LLKVEFFIKKAVSHPMATDRNGGAIELFHGEVEDGTAGEDHIGTRRGKAGYISSFLKGS
jgi:hypothetical protein